jgi:pyridoxine 5-phosphate synthase|tara:strand:- start:369 stop:1088 length:720 start_codon:yes stop_codon:yes gene_type:complete
MKRLGLNIDHVATLRNARGGIHPDPLVTAKFAMKCGADSITIHLREDRRHINDSDVFKICKNKKIPVNLEIALDEKIIKIALKNKPNFICIVPEKRKEITTEGGLNLDKHKNKIKKALKDFKKSGIRTSLFINPNIKNIKLSKKLMTDCVELHTGKLSELIKLGKSYNKEFLKIKQCSNFADKLGLEVHAGHGLDYKSTKILNKINPIKEFNIGHFIIGEAILFGLNKVLKRFKTISNK